MKIKADFLCIVYTLGCPIRAIPWYQSTCGNDLGKFTSGRWWQVSDSAHFDFPILHHSTVQHVLNLLCPQVNATF